LKPATGKGTKNSERSADLNLEEHEEEEQEEEEEEDQKEQQEQQEEENDEDLEYHSEVEVQPAKKRKHSFTSSPVTRVTARKKSAGPKKPATHPSPIDIPSDESATVDGSSEAGEGTLPDSLNVYSGSSSSDDNERNAVLDNDDMELIQQNKAGIINLLVILVYFSIL